MLRRLASRAVHPVSVHGGHFLLLLDPLWKITVSNVPGLHRPIRACSRDIWQHHRVKTRCMPTSPAIFQAGLNFLGLRSVIADCKAGADIDDPIPKPVRRQLQRDVAARLTRDALRSPNHQALRVRGIAGSVGLHDDKACDHDGRVDRYAGTGRRIARRCQDAGAPHECGAIGGGHQRDRHLVGGSLADGL